MGFTTLPMKEIRATITGRPRDTAQNAVIACFVSSHGFGHAARAAAILSALARCVPHFRFHIYSTVPNWFFKASLDAPFHQERIETDVGLAQQTPLKEDLGKTADRLDRFFPLDSRTVEQTAEQLVHRQTKLVICDIAPLGIVAARSAGIHSVLVENFTWDWIYQGYAALQPRLIPHIAYLKALFDQVDLRIRTRPECGTAKADFVVGPVSRRPRASRASVRRRLGAAPGEKLVMVSLGGTPLAMKMLGANDILPGIRVIVPGAPRDLSRIHPQLHSLPADGFFHPDLIGACDGVIGKTGYSTLAEIFHAGTPFGYVSRRGFREAPVLEAFARGIMGALPLTEDDLRSGAWTRRLPELIENPCRPAGEPNGADAAARFIHHFLEQNENNRRNRTSRPA
jgi:UDP:flavonoid glycosyltransferase YjiC (YdhE family)